MLHHTVTTTDPTLRIVTNDCYLVAFLLSRGCRLDAMWNSQGKRITFAVEGENASTLRTEFNTGTVVMNVRLFKEHLVKIKREMETLKHRSAAHEPSPFLTAQSQC